MLKVVKIIEGGIDLETREELPRSIVISDGQREVLVPVNDNVIRELGSLLAGNSGSGPVRSRTKPKNAPLAQSRPVSPQPVAAAIEDPFGAEAELPPDEDFEPGEEFSDSGTGASSI
jgi:hypothetical protein